ncbi:MAG: MFS transporter [Bacteroidales bacterium]|nr:MFS transporter [Bacteroidales bacterium]
MFNNPSASAIRSLRHRNYRLYFFGQLISLPGNWIQNIALGWLVYRLTDSALLLGVVGFAGQIPSLLLTPLAGVYADRIDRRKVLIVTQTISMLIALTVASLIFSGRIQVWHILVSAALNGISVAFDTPFRHAFLVNMVTDRTDLQNAIALNSTLFNTARFAGPPLGGLLIALSGEGVCFMINGLSYLAVIASLMAMHIDTRVESTKHASVFSELMSGLSYAYKALPIRYLLIMVITTSLLGLPFQVFMPVFAREVLHGNAQTLGYLIGAIGAGALIGAVYLATRKSLNGIPMIIFISATMFSIGLMAFSVSTGLLISIALLIITGFGMVVEFASSNTLLQTMVDDQMRGRIVALYSMSFMGFTPLGSLLMGSLAEMAGVQVTVFAAGACCLLAAILFYKKLPEIKKAVAGISF